MARQARKGPFKVLSCRDVTEEANAYIDGELGLWPRTKFRMHLLACKYCRGFVEQMQTVVNLTQRYGDTQSDSEPSQDLMDSFRRKTGGPSRQTDAA
jgi:hypothetical protein